MRRVGTRTALATAGRLSTACGVLLALRCGGDSERHAPRDPGPAPTRVPDPTPTTETLALASAQCDYLEPTWTPYDEFKRRIEGVRPSRAPRMLATR